MRIGEEQDKEAGPEPLEVPIPKRGHGETRYRVTGDEQIEPMVAASEYDAALDMIRVLVFEYTIDHPAEATQLVEAKLGSDAAEWLRRVVIDEECARELFA